MAASGAAAVCPCAGAAAAGQHQGAAVRGTQEPRGAPAAGDARPPRPGRGSTDRPLPGSQRGTGPRAAGPCAVQASRGSLALSGCFQVFPHCAFNVSVRKNPKMHLSIKSGSWARRPRTGWLRAGWTLSGAPLGEAGLSPTTPHRRPAWVAADRPEVNLPQAVGAGQGRGHPVREQHAWV